MRTPDATYTGLTEYSFRNFRVLTLKITIILRFFGPLIDMIYTNQLSANLVGNTKAYLNVFDRKWWREDDVFIRAGASQSEDISPVPYFSLATLFALEADRVVWVFCGLFM